VQKTGYEAGEESKDLGGLFISEAEINSIIQAVCCGSAAYRVQALKSEEIETWDRTISRKKAESLKRGIELRSFIDLCAL